MNDQHSQSGSEQRTARIATIPNLISASRLGMAIGLPFVDAEWRLPLLIAGALSDYLDGMMAMVLRSRSTVGQLLDPFADKALFLSALLTLMLSGEIEWWQAALVMLRDFVVLGAVMITAARGKWRDFTRMKPTMLGKITTVFVFVWLVAILAPWEWAHAIRTPALYSAIACSAIAAIDYLRRMAPELRAPRQPR